jgi:hypothetical protein
VIFRKVTKSHVRTEVIVAVVLEQRGEHSSLATSAMEAFDDYKAWRARPICARIADWPSWNNSRPLAFHASSAGRATSV